MVLWVLFPQHTWFDLGYLLTFVASWYSHLDVFILVSILSDPYVSYFELTCFIIVHDLIPLSWLEDGVDYSQVLWSSFHIPLDIKFSIFHDARFDWLLMFSFWLLTCRVLTYMHLDGALVDFVYAHHLTLFYQHSFHVGGIFSILLTKVGHFQRIIIGHITGHDFIWLYVSHIGHCILGYTSFIEIIRSLVDFMVIWSVCWSLWVILSL